MIISYDVEVKPNEDFSWGCFARCCVMVNSGSHGTL